METINDGKLLANLGIRAGESKLELMTIKELLLEKGIITEEEYATKYNQVCEKYAGEVYAGIIDMRIDELNKTLEGNEE